MPEIRAGTLVDKGCTVGHFIIMPGLTMCFTREDDWSLQVSLLVAAGERVQVGHEIEVGGAPWATIQ